MPYSFKSNQSSSARSRQSDPQGLPPLGDKAIERTTAYLDLVTRILDGKILVLGEQGKSDSWIKAQIDKTITSYGTADDKGAYYKDYTPERVRSSNPMSQNFIVARLQAEKELKEYGLHHARIAGSPSTFQPFVDLTKRVDSANMSVAIAGDMHALEEVLYILQKKINVIDDPDNGGELLDYPLIIENVLDGTLHGFWDEILRGVKILRKGTGNPIDQERAYIDFDILAEHYGIYVTENRSETLRVASILYAGLPEPIEVLSPASLSEGAVCFLATGTEKKYQQLKKIFEAQNLQIEIRSIFELVDIYNPPKEDRRTYSGNCAVKIEAAFEAWEAMSEEDRVSRLKKLSLKKEQVYILAEDSGFELKEPDIIHEEEFNDIRHMVDTTAPFPGVETGPGIFGMNGIQGFIDNLGRIKDRRDHFDNGLVARCVLGLASLKQVYHPLEIFMTTAEVEGHFVFNPAPAGKTVEIDNFLVPHIHDSKGRTEAQLGDYYYHNQNARSKAWAGMAASLKIPKLQPGYSYKRKVEDEFKAGIVTDSGHYDLLTQAFNFVRSPGADGFSTSILSAAIDQPSDVQHKILEKADGIILCLDPKQSKGNFWRNLYISTSLIVAEQTHDKMKLRKPLVIVDPEGTFAPIADLVWDFHKIGTVMQDPKTLFSVVKTLDEAMHILHQARSDYNRFDPPAYMTQERPNSILGTTRIDPKKYKTAIYCSASNENAKVLEEARFVTKEFVEQGIIIVSGAGTHGPMGEVTSTANDMRHSHRAIHIGSNVPHIMQSEGDARTLMTQFLLARHIYERMDYMGCADSSLIEMGGTGTVQELSRNAWLKERDWKNGVQDQKTDPQKPIALVNSSIRISNNGLRGFYDHLLGIVPEGNLDRVGIHPVSNAKEGVEKIKEWRKARDHALGI